MNLVNYDRCGQYVVVTFREGRHQHVQVLRNGIFCHTLFYKGPKDRYQFCVEGRVFTGYKRLAMAIIILYLQTGTLHPALVRSDVQMTPWSCAFDALSNAFTHVSSSNAVSVFRTDRGCVVVRPGDLRCTAKVLRENGSCITLYLDRECMNRPELREVMDSLDYGGCCQYSLIDSETCMVIKRVLRFTEEL
jgi:hypothetical protein